MPDIARNLKLVSDRITTASAERTDSSLRVVLIAVSKTVPIDLVKAAAEAGQRDFGESKLQEAAPKILGLPAYLEWHFIGRVQRNKVRKLLPLFKYIHAVDSFRLAAYIGEIASETSFLPKIFLQVNLGNESSKGGFSPDDLYQQMPALLDLRSVLIVGLMCIPPSTPDAESARPWFVMLRTLRNELQTKFQAKLPCLSMGMSGDFEVAIEEGASHVRVGSAIFGRRSYRVDGELG